jgi:hypothetical protein
MHSGCESCQRLSHFLHDAEEGLNSARLRTLAGRERSDEFQAALREMQSFHIEVQAIRAEVERHRAEHHELP